jgi:hypothetical protein
MKPNFIRSFFVCVSIYSQNKQQSSPYTKTKRLVFLKNSFFGGFELNFQVLHEFHTT